LSLRRPGMTIGKVSPVGAELKSIDTSHAEIHLSSLTPTIQVGIALEPIKRVVRCSSPG
jgi:hypothetical protein